MNQFNNRLYTDNKNTAESIFIYVVEVYLFLFYILNTWSDSV